jgi:outer membrane lipoprotein-sorting protein
MKILNQMEMKKKMTRRSILVSIALGAVSCAALLAQGPPPGPMGFGGFGARGPGIRGAGPGPRTVVTGAPYSATETLQSQQTLSNGNQISRSSQSNVYRDSQGRVRTEETITPPASSGKAAYTLVTIFDPVGGYSYLLNSSTMTAIQTPLPKLPAASASGSTTTPPQRPANPNIVVTDLGTQTVNGVAATGKQTTDTIPAGAIGNAQAIQIVRTTWISTELKLPVRIQTSDPRLGTSDMELTNIAQTEPSASLFVVPAGYTVSTGHGPRGGPGGGPAGQMMRGPRQAPQ